VFRKLTLAAAAGAGYVLGAKAGKERYAQIESKFREIAGMPAVQNATTTVMGTASSVAGTAKQTVNEKVESVAGSSGSGGSGSSGSGSGGSGSSGSSGSGSGGSGAGSLDEDVVVVDLGTGANTGATAPGSTPPGAIVPGVTRSDTV
jgi:uncharacterized membrane protein YgcG